MDEVTLTLSSPMTEEQWDMIADYDFNYTNEITFHTKHGKKVRFVKETAQPERKMGKWIEHNPHKWGLGIKYECSECGYEVDCEEPNYCPNCGADMRDPLTGNMNPPEDE